MAGPNQEGERRPEGATISPTSAQKSPPDPAPRFIRTDFSADLTPPTTQRTATQPAPSRDTPRTHNTPTSNEGSSWLRNTLRFTRSLVTSNNFYTSIGNILITSNLYSGALLHPVCALLAISNESRERCREEGEYQNPPPSFTGIAQKALDLWRSPGIYRVALSGAFFLNTIESAVAGNTLFSVIYLCASLGNIGAARTLNRDYFQSLYKERGVEYKPRESAAVNLLTSPGINWSVTDLLIGMMTLPSLGNLGSTLAYSAAACACAAVVAPLVLGNRATSSPLLLACNALANLGFSAVHALWGSTLIAISCCGWGIASALIARKQHLQNTQKQRGADQ
jgi:hypothetical protein